MTDLPPPPPGSGAGPPRSVVVDAHTTVKKSRVGVIVGAVVVVALVAGFVVWFASADDGKGDHQPGPDALAVVAGLEAAEIRVAFTNDELKCIDEAFAGVDLADLEGAFDPLGGEMSDDVDDRTGKMFDDCLGDATRIEIIEQSLAASDLGTDEQRACAAAKYDALIADSGGYRKLANDEVDISDATVSAFAECGIDLFGGGKPACETERLTLDTAIEAYFADNGVDATSLDDLMRTFLSEDPSERFEFVAGEDGGTPTFVGIGECEGY